jgi:hypothetical protein
MTMYAGQRVFSGVAFVTALLAAALLAGCAMEDDDDAAPGPGSWEVDEQSATSGEATAEESAEAAAALGATISVPSVEAAGNCTYYSDASHTTVVGQYGYDCCNNRIAWGAKTQYSQCGGCFICYPPPQ